MAAAASRPLAAARGDFADDCGATHDQLRGERLRQPQRCVTVGTARNRLAHRVGDPQPRMCT